MPPPAPLDCRIVQVPQPPLEPEGSPAGAWMLPTVATAHAAERSLACCWIRGRPHGRVAVLAGGVGFSANTAGPVPVAFPVGARGVPLSGEQTAKALGRLPNWQPVALALECIAPTVSGPALGPSLEDLFALLPDRAMAVLVVARPINGAATAQRFDALSDAVAQLERRRDGRGSDRISLARATAELAYLERWAPLGWWELRVWTAGSDATDSTSVAALLAGCRDVATGPLRVRPSVPAGGGSALEWAATCGVGADVVTSLVRPPVRELPGIRVTAVPEFDQTPETRPELTMGTVLDAAGLPSIPFGVPKDSVNRHVFVCGATGSGKSQTVRALLARLALAGVPWLVIEPAKAEYARMAGRLGDGRVLVVRPGRPDAPAASLNPLEPSSVEVAGRVVRFPLQTHVDLVRALFTASFEAEEPFPQILAAAMTRCYEGQGWNLTLGRPVDGAQPRWPTLGDLQRQALAAIDDVGYGPEIAQNMRGFVRVRIDSLRIGTPGRFFEGGHPLDLTAVLAGNVVFEIEDLGDDRDKAFFIGCLLIRLFETLRLREANGLTGRGLAHVTVIEEAHRLLRRASPGTPAAQAVTMFADLLAEVRAYGEGVVVAEQIPAKLVPDVVKNSAVKIMHRLPAADDREFVGATMNLTPPQSRFVVALPPGHAVAHADGMDRPVLVAVDGSGEAHESSHNAVHLPPVLPRHAGCPVSCVGEPCTLEQIVLSDTVPRRARIDLWAELGVLAHLLGHPLGSLAQPWLTELRSMDRRRLGCAVGSAVAAAVDRRWQVIRRSYPPGELVRLVSEVLRNQVAQGLDVAEPELRWRVGQFRWAVVIRALEKEPAMGQSSSAPHPDTRSWARHGMQVRGRTWSEQAAAAYQAAERDEVDVRALLVGDPPVIDRLAAAVAAGPDPQIRLTRAVTILGLRSDWPSFRLRHCWEQM